MLYITPSKRTKATLVLLGSAVRHKYVKSLQQTFIPQINACTAAWIHRLFLTQHENRIHANLNCDKILVTAQKRISLNYWKFPVVQIVLQCIYHTFECISISGSCVLLWLFHFKIKNQQALISKILCSDLILSETIHQLIRHSHHQKKALFYSAEQAYWTYVWICFAMKTAHR